MTGRTATVPTRRGRALLLVSAVAVGLVLVVGSLLAGDRSDAPLDPDNPARDGAQAVARVVADRGTPVTVVRSQADLLDTDVSGATVVVSDPGGLGPSTAETLLDHAADATALVVVGEADRLADLVLGDSSGDLVSTRQAAEVAADCDLPLVADLVASLDDGLDLDDPDGVSCFGRPGPLLVTEDLAPETTWLLAAPEVLANATVTDADNAALALRLLEQGDRVVWYVPDSSDVPAGDAVGLGSFLPPWLVPGLWLLALATVAALLWRGRRLGPLAVEPLPVVVRASESTEARGRMYHRSRDRAHAAAVLREATRTRLAHLLRLPGEASASQVAEAAASRGGPDPRETVSLLTDPPPTSDAGLADLGRRLRRLEDEVHRP